MLLYLALFSGLSMYMLIRGLIVGVIQAVIPPIYTVRSVETAGFICDTYLYTKRLVWLNGIGKPTKISARAHPHEGDECILREYWIGSKLLHAKIVCLASRSSGELNYF